VSKTNKEIPFVTHVFSIGRNRLQEGSKTLHDASRRVQEAPRSSKTPPRRLHDSPRRSTTPPRRSRMPLSRSKTLHQERLQFSTFSASIDQRALRSSLRSIPERFEATSKQLRQHQTQHRQQMELQNNSNTSSRRFKSLQDASKSGQVSQSR
jgi:hypothetical protein